ncbi:MAG: HAMP domain-containing histidine kinase [Actinobacteria bacterium]|nr:HAMP domain-containing histidine kinase [Actinomycetota bacterium]
MITPQSLGQRWRQSLRFRAVVTTVLLTMLVVIIVGTLLMTVIANGLREERERSALAEADAGRSIARSAAENREGQPAKEVVDELIADLSARAGKPPQFDVALIPEPGTGLPGASTPLVDESTIPPELREAVAANSGLIRYPTTINYTDGRSVPGIVVGAPVNIRGLGRFELFYLVPMTSVERAIAEIRSAVIGAGVTLIVLLGVIAWWLSRRLVRPLQEVGATADALASGELDRRVEVRGEDEVARLGSAFNVMADNLSHQISALQALSEAQRRFVSDVSHELRTPLTTIRMAADVTSAKLPDSDPSAVRAGELLEAEVDRFEQLLADLLEVSRHDAGAARLDLEETRLDVLVAEVLEPLRPVAGEHDVTLELSTSVNEDFCALETDTRRVSRIVRNLVINAIEHGSGAPVSVAVRCREDGVSVLVTDRGPGVPPEQAEQIFRRFWRGDPSRTRTLGGTGLGLAISRDDARLHGGDLTVVSVPGVRTTFELFLPREQSSQTPDTQSGDRSPAQA